MANLAEKQNGKPPPEAAEVVKKQMRPSSLFPQHKLQDVICIPESVENTKRWAADTAERHRHRSRKEPR
jgi:hypothetical protein